MYEVEVFKCIDDFSQEANSESDALEKAEELVKGLSHVYRLDSKDNVFIRIKSTSSNE